MQGLSGREPGATAPNPSHTAWPPVGLTAQAYYVQVIPFSRIIREAVEAGPMTGRKATAPAFRTAEAFTPKCSSCRFPQT
jgi:hypothetical protein